MRPDHSARRARFVRGPWPRLLAALLVAVLLGAALRPAATAAAGPPRVHPALVQDAATNPDQSFRVIVTRQGAGAEDYLASKGYAKVEDVGAVGFVALVKGRDLADLGTQPSVKSVAPDASVLPTATVDTSRLATLYSQAVGATTLYGSGLTGAGVGVAVLDTGLNQGSGDFSDGAGHSRVVYQGKFSSTTNDMSDGYGHGTHVAGIIAGDSWYDTANPAAQGKYLGVAPGANLINLKVSDDSGQSYTSDVANAIEWAIANRQAYNIRVLNLSLLATTAESYTTSALDAEVERAWFSGILVVTSAGNTGAGSMLYPPANDPFVVTVGASDTMGTVSPSDDTIAPWSSYGLTQDGFPKPEVVAPGRVVVSNLASGGCVLAKQFPDRVVDGTYLWLSGTSMATPVVSGVAALAFQAHSGWTNDQVKWLLAQQAVRLTVGGLPLPGSGAGEVSAPGVATYSSTPGYANQGIVISAYLVGPGGATTYANTAPSSSWSTSSWSTSSWSTSTWSTSSWSTSSWSTSSWSTATSQSSTWK